MTNTGNAPSRTVVFVDMGVHPKKPAARIIYAYENGSKVRSGEFYGYIKGNRVSLYPCNWITRARYRDVSDITIFDLKSRRSYDIS